jgi:hypothetical protein
MAAEDSIFVNLSDGRSSDDVEQLSESQTLLQQNEETVWKPPKGFIWIQVGTLAYPQD